MKKIVVCSGALIAAAMPLSGWGRSVDATTQAGGAAPAAEVAANADSASSDIVVTARKRSESITSVPVAVTAIGAATLRNNLVTSVTDLQKLAPGATIRPVTTTSISLAPYIRGIGTRSADPTADLAIGISVDGVYLPTIAGSSIIDMFDIAQVEVLRGPQGTLQGRNSPGGAVNFTSIRPSGEFHANGEVTYGSYDELHLRGAVEAPIVAGVLSARLSLSNDSGGGYLTSVPLGIKYGGKKAWGARLGVLFTPDSATTAYLTGDYTKDQSLPVALRPVPQNVAYPRQPIPRVCTVAGVCSPYPEYQNGSGFYAPSKAEVYGFAGNITHDFGGISLTSVTGYREIHILEQNDTDAIPAAIIQTENRRLNITSFTQELRLASDDTKKFEWLVGAFYGRTKFDLVEPSRILGALGIRYNNQTAPSYAVFGHAIYKFNSHLSISAGARETWDKKTLDTQPSGATSFRHFIHKWNNFSPEASIDYKLDGGGVIYARFAKGYRSGGINSGVAARAEEDAFQPEKDTTYEVGFKDHLPGGLGTLALAAYWSEYKDLQQVVTVVIDNSPLRLTRNAASARIRGFEVETTLTPMRNLTIQANAAFTDAKYKTFFADLLGTKQPADFSFLTLPYVSKWTAFASADYRIPLGGGFLKLNGNVEYRSHTNLSGTLQTQVGDQPGYALLGASIGFESADGRYSLTAFGRNLTDKYYINGAENISGLVAWQVVGRPRTFGVRLAARM